jgi:hypothetical protein
MRAVALSDPAVRDWANGRSVPLKVVIEPGTKRFPLDWPAMGGWATAYQFLGGEKNEGFTGCSLVSPDLSVEFASTGSAHVWELFDSPAYDRDKFLAMLERGWTRHREFAAALHDPNSSPRQRDAKAERLRRQFRAQVASEGRFRLPPKGFTIEGAVELFRLSGDLDDR